MSQEIKESEIHAYEKELESFSAGLYRTVSVKVEHLKLFLSNLTLIDQQAQEIAKLTEEIELLKNPKDTVYVIKAKDKPEYVKHKLAEKCFTKNIGEAIKFSDKAKAEEECMSDEVVVPYVKKR